MSSTAVLALDWVLSYGVESMCVAIATNTIQQARLERQARLEQLELQVRRARCARYWHRYVNHDTVAGLQLFKAILF